MDLAPTNHDPERRSRPYSCPIACEQTDDPYARTEDTVRRFGCMPMTADMKCSTTDPRTGRIHDSKWLDAGLRLLETEGGRQ